MIKDGYQQPSFKFETNIAKYDVNYIGHTQGEEHWRVDVAYRSSETLTGTFICPASWSRELIFGWLSRMEISEY